jgi:hypothetical protein
MGTAKFQVLLMLVATAAGCGAGHREAVPAVVTDVGEARIAAGTMENLEQALVERHGAAQRERIGRGLQQVAARWRPEDGAASELQAFALEHFLSQAEALRDTARHLEYALEMLDGHGHEMERELARFQDLDAEPLQPVDALLAAYSPSSHFNEDLFRNRVAFVALLNFPLTTLEQRLAEGTNWSRDQWALARLTGRFEYRLPATVLQQIEGVAAAASRYIDTYNIHMSRLSRAGEPAGFAEDQKLISHWGLRDEIRALYGQPGGLAKQRLIATVMERIVLQEIPAAVIDSSSLAWDPETNLVREPGSDRWRPAEREADERYEHLRAVFQAHRRADPSFPALNSHIARSFALEREMPEERIHALLESVLLSDLAPRVGALISSRLGRPLEPFDLWYANFRSGSRVEQDHLDRLVAERYPTAESFNDDLPRLLTQLGFDETTAGFLAQHIEVEGSRGAGEAVGALRRQDSARLRTRVGANGMDYKGFNIAIHELGHTVEQVFSMTGIDRTLLQGVPNAGFTEAFAFLFQQRDLELLGQSPSPAPEAESLHALDRFWRTYEIAGVALLDLDIWHWMYDHPEATAAELREAVVRLARQNWNQYYAPVFGVSDVLLPAIYSHIIALGLYTPDYPLGFIITSQVEAYLSSRNIAPEMARMCRLGRLAPDIWMHRAVGQQVSSEALLGETATALSQLAQESPSNAKPAGLP